MAKTRFKHVDVVNVHLWGQHIGAVSKQPNSRFYGFAYTPAFAKTGIEPAPLHMPARSDLVYAFPDLLEETFQGLPAMLADALPDRFGNMLIRQYLSEHGIDEHEITTLDRLAYMGHRSMGALEFRPPIGGGGRTSTAIELKSIVEEARCTIEGICDTEASSKKSLRDLIKVGTSAGGARAKVVIAWNPQSKEIRSGQADCPDGFIQCLLKLDGVQDQVLATPKNFGREEYAYYLMATAAGIKMSHCELLEENGRAHFLTHRFDRDQNVKHHIQTLCAMAHLDFRFPGRNSYTQLFQTIRKLNLSIEAIEEAYRRMVFNILAMNRDDHTKNFSFRLRQGSAWELSPAYDITFAYMPNNIWIDHHNLRVNGKIEMISLKDLEVEADRAGLGFAWKRILEEVQSAIGQWPTFAKSAGVKLSRMQEIKKLLPSI